MKENFISIKEIKTPIKLTAKIYLYDVFFIAIYTAVFLQVRFLVSTYLIYPYAIACIIWGLFFTMPSRINHGKRNWQTLFLFLIRNRVCYTDINICKKKTEGVHTL